MEKSIIYVSPVSKKRHVINFKNLLETAGNIDNYILQDKVFERPDHDFSLPMSIVKSGAVVWDIGAYIGTFSIPFAIEGFEVHAFEGFPSNFERTKINCAPYNNIKVHQCALSNENKKVISKFGDCTATEQKPVEIEYFMLDEYVQNNKIPSPKLVKMDIEGMESLALLEMKRVLEYSRPIWLIGFHHPGNILLENPEQKIEGYAGFVTSEEGGFDFDRFKELGYEIFDLKRHSYCTNKEEWFKWGDCNGEYMCIPSELIELRKMPNGSVTFTMI